MVLRVFVCVCLCERECVCMTECVMGVFGFIYLLLYVSVFLIVKLQLLRVIRGTEGINVVGNSNSGSFQITHFRYEL